MVESRPFFLKDQATAFEVLETTVKAVGNILSFGYFGVETEATKIYPPQTFFIGGLPPREEVPIIIIDRRIVRNKRLK